MTHSPSVLQAPTCILQHTPTAAFPSRCFPKFFNCPSLSHPLSTHARHAGEAPPGTTIAIDAIQVWQQAAAA